MELTDPLWKTFKPGYNFDILSQNNINRELVGETSLKIDAFSVIIGNSVKLVNSSIR